ncbi:Protein RER1D [Bienertia sinuspersici]
MNKENGEINDSAEPVPRLNWRTNLHKKFQYQLDRSVPHHLRRWLVTLGVAMIYILRVYWVKGFHVVSYGLATYVLNLLIGFLSPNVDPDLEGRDGISSPGRDNTEYKPFERRVPEFRFWYSITKAFIVSFMLTFISVLDVPVFWPILSSYWVFLFVLTMKRQLVHMIKYKYNPFSTAKPISLQHSNNRGFEASPCENIEMIIAISAEDDDGVRCLTLPMLRQNGKEMDILFQAALRGDVEELHELLAKSPLILYQVSFLSAQNPLHFASAAGHLDFARKILELKPEFARQLNEDGYSPIHLASANGHVDIVREIIKVDSNICRLEGGDGRTPLHLAVLGGRIDVISEMLATCEGCLKDLTMQKETALHLAVRNFQLASLRVLLDWSKHKNKEILNMKDEHGNTILHLAIWKKQRQAINLISSKQAVVELLLRNYSGILEVNAVNKSGLTALDLLLIFPSEAGDREIQEILQGAGASKAQNLIPNSTTCNSTTNLDPPSNNCRAKDLIDFFRFHDGRDSPSDVRSTLLVIAVLVATATYQVGISPPGDVWQEDDEGHVAGTSIMATHNLVSYILLVSSNSIGFNVSLYMICTLTSKFPLQTELQVCIFALYMTFITAVTATSPKSTRLFTNVFTSALPTVVPLSCFLLRKYRVIQRTVCILEIFRRRIQMRG